MFVKHIGRHGDRRVAIVFREVPGEDHMALVIYPELLPRTFHDAIMPVLESEAGQQSENLGDILFRSLLPDGRSMLETLHKEGMIKKVQTNQITVTPNVKSHVRLDELNKVINQMKTGEAAKAQMEALDINSGLVDPSIARKHMPQAPAINTVTALSDVDIANQLRSQATRMANEANTMLAESQRLISEAEKLQPTTPPKRARKPKQALVGEDAA